MFQLHKHTNVMMRLRTNDRDWLATNKKKISNDFINDAADTIGDSNKT